MNYTQERMKKQQERERAVMHLDDFLHTAEIEDFVGIVNETMQKHYDHDLHKKYFNNHTQQRIELTVNNCHPKARAIASVLGESMPAEEFATHIAEVLRNEYGSHNFLPFITKLINELDNDIA